MQLKIVPNFPCTDLLLMSNFSPSTSVGAMARREIRWSLKT